MTKKEAYAAARKAFPEIWASLDQVAAAQAQTEKDFAKWRKEFGNYADTESKCLEDEFRDAINAAGSLNGSRVDAQSRLVAKRNGIIKAEHDVVAIGEDVIYVGEIKHKLAESDVREFAKKKLPRFAKDHPIIARGKEITGMVGGAFLEKNAVKAALDLGLYVLQLANNRKLSVRAPKAKR